MVFALATVASAEDAHTDTITSVDSSNTATGVVHVTVTNSVTTTYKVDVTWESLDFAYNYGGYDTSSHLYTGGWVDSRTTSTVTVTNHSNAPIRFSAEANKEAADGLEGVTLALEGTYTNVDLLSAYGTSGINVPKATFTVKVGGAPAQTTMTDAKLGTVTVTITEGT